MATNKVLLPEGVQDLLIDDCMYRRDIENNLIKTFQKAGYMEVSSPTLEYYQMFPQDYLDMNGDKMFKLIDTKGSLLVLRPDGTIPIARIVATKMRDFVYPLKLCYIENVFRIDQEQAGRKREFRQAGLEVFGVESVVADGEVIITAIESLKELGLEDFQIEIGQISFINELVKVLGISGEEKATLIGYIEKRSFVEIDMLMKGLVVDEDLQQLFKNIMGMFGSPARVLKDLRKLSLTGEMKQATDELEMVCQMIEEYGYGQYISIDLGLVSPMGYYTGIIFKGFTKDLGTVICSGGRYDRLLENFGLECPATGFALILNRVTKALKIQGKLRENINKQVLVVKNQQRPLETMKLIKSLRSNDYRVEMALLEDLESIFRYCKKRKIDELWQLSDDGDWIVNEIEGVEDWRSLRLV